MYRGNTPRFMRRFKRMLTIQDLITGRKTVISYTDIATGMQKERIENNDKPQFEHRLTKSRVHPGSGQPELPIAAERVSAVRLQNVLDNPAAIG